MTNSDYKTNKHNTTLVLKPLKGMRGKKHDTLKGATVEAIIRISDDNRKDYDHPRVTLYKVRPEAGDRMMQEMLTIEYQRHNCNVDKSWRIYPETPVKGFLAGAHGHWSRSYAGKVSGELERAEYLLTSMTLIQRAQEALSNNDKLDRGLRKTDDDLLRLIVGLRLIGVTVIVEGVRRARPHCGDYASALAA
jgi:hypothetical protein